MSLDLPTFELFLALMSLKYQHSGGAISVAEFANLELLMTPSHWHFLFSIINALQKVGGQWDHDFTKFSNGLFQMIVWH